MFFVGRGADATALSDFRKSIIFNLLRASIR